VLVKLSGGFNVKAVLRYDCGVLGRSRATYGGKELSYLRGWQVVRSKSSEQRHGEVVAGTIARCQYKIHLKFHRPNPLAVAGGIRNGECS